MVIHLKNNVKEDQAAQLAEKSKALYFRENGTHVLVNSSKEKNLPGFLEAYTDNFYTFDSDIQLADHSYLPSKRKIKVGNREIGGKQQNTMMISGPCSIESEEQITQSAELLNGLGISTLRAGCYKPRTSPYSFQGLGLEGLKLLDKIRAQYGLNIITEVRDATHVDDVIAYADIVQIGAKAMYDQGILRKCAKADKPVLLKRHFGATLQEFVQAAEFVLSGGNSQVMLCERGIRTFETKTRFTLDLCGVAYLKTYTNLPVILDTSHAMGFAYGVPDLTRACMAMGVDGLLIETHPDPSVAKSDASQQLDHQEFTAMYQSLQPIADSIGRNII